MSSSTEQMPRTTANRVTDGLLPAVALDVLAVLIFVIVGRISHDESITPGGAARTAWPFLVGVAGGVLGLVLMRLRPASYPGAAMMLVKTVILGLILRFAVAQDDVEPAFVLVTVAVLAALMFGWRAVAARIR